MVHPETIDGRTDIPDELKYEAATTVGDTVDPQDGMLWKIEETPDGHKVVILSADALALAEGRTNNIPPAYEPLVATVTNTRGNVIKATTRNNHWHPKVVKISDTLELGLHDFAELNRDIQLQMGAQ